MRDGVARDSRRALRRLSEGQATGQTGAEGGRVRAPSPVRGAGVEPRDRDLDVLPAVKEVVDWLTVPAGDDDGRRAESVDPLRQLGLPNSLLLDPGEDLRLGEVGRHDDGEREEPLDQRLDRV